MLNNGLFICGVLALLLASQVQAAPGGGNGGLWLSGGQDQTNARHQAFESRISPDTVAGLQVSWAFTTGGPVSATPAVDGTTVYFPDFAGNLYALNRRTGAVIWQRSVTEYADLDYPQAPPNNYARGTPAVADGVVIFGDQGGRAALETFNPAVIGINGGARVRAVDRMTGDLVWSTLVDDHPAAIVTSSPTVQGNVVYVAVASYEEGYAGFIPVEYYGCCSYRGSVVALDVKTGELLWKTYMTPDTEPDGMVDYSGAAVWGSSPVVDTDRRSVYIATGNNYSVPASVTDCIVENAGDPDAQKNCLDPANLVDAVVALDMNTGAVKWATSVEPFDTWNVGCLDFLGLPIDTRHCPTPEAAEGPDFDFGQAPVLFSSGKGSKRVDRLGIGQKSGYFYALDPDTGEIVWQTKAGIGGVGGGFQWGSATDGVRFYGGEANSFAAAWPLSDGSTTFSGGWAATDPATGEILWQTANPVPVAPAGGAVSVANGVVFGCAQSSFIGVVGDNMFALDAATGAILWSHDAGGSCNSGAAISDGAVFWGFGYPGDLRENAGFGMISFGLGD